MDPRIKSEGDRWGSVEQARSIFNFTVIAGLDPAIHGSANLDIVNYASTDSATMSKVTRATQALEKAGIAFSTHTYDYDPDADSIGLQAAAALGEDPARVLKTLMALVDGKPACVILPSDREVAMKKLAAALGGKSAEMMKPADAERVTGYKVGGISPFGQMKKVRTVIEQTALENGYVYVNGGQRGLQVRLAPRAIIETLAALAAPVVA
jgi:Cys-tRNA(Pro)/Cys-tRNA(Cys) deacylase